MSRDFIDSASEVLDQQDYPYAIVMGGSNIENDECLIFTDFNLKGINLSNNDALDNAILILCALDKIKEEIKVEYGISENED